MVTSVESKQLCPSCGAINRPEARYCHVCSSALGNDVLPPGNPAALSTGTTLSGRYRVMDRLGKGGMGSVYQVEDLRINGKTWALKEMSTQALSTAEEKAEAKHLFEQEAHLLASLDHSNLPKVVDYFAEGRNIYLVLEFVQGKTLEKIMVERGGPLAETEVASWTAQLCDVLEYLHTHQPPVIFRDLKPQNIMLNEQRRIKLVDFGIARFFKPGQQGDTTAFGTAGYAPPEQYGKGQTDPRSDIYALGATLHHLLTGVDPEQKPFQFAPVRQLNPAISPEMERLIMHALEPDPAKRFPDIGAVREALRLTPFAPTMTVQLAPPPPLTSRQKFQRAVVDYGLVGMSLAVLIAINWILQFVLGAQYDQTGPLQGFTYGLWLCGVPLAYGLMPRQNRGLLFGILQVIVAGVLLFAPAGFTSIGLGQTGLRLLAALVMAGTILLAENPPPSFTLLLAATIAATTLDQVAMAVFPQFNLSQAFQNAPVYYFGALFAAALSFSLSRSLRR
ncbi:MAG: serine/threonine protein kinase [Chloroflexi bacterium]|nr:serine/threonine protein kinase [Chloroflexota bacterium]